MKYLIFLINFFYHTYYISYHLFNIFLKNNGMVKIENRFNLNRFKMDWMELKF